MVSTWRDTLLVSLELFIESANDTHKEKKTDDQFSFFCAQKKTIYFLDYII